MKFNALDVHREDMHTENSYLSPNFLILQAQSTRKPCDVLKNPEESAAFKQQPIGVPGQAVTAGSNDRGREEIAACVWQR